MRGQVMRGQVMRGQEMMTPGLLRQRPLVSHPGSISACLPLILIYCMSLIVNAESSPHTLTLFITTEDP